MKEILLLISSAIISVIVVLAPMGCATIVPPPGGDRDSLPPTVLMTTPPDSSLKFGVKKIELTFNEYVDVANSQQEVFVSPLTKTNPIVEYKLKTVTVRFSNKDTLDPNTTYTIDFGQAIKDLNEGNIMKNYRYTFSTGNYFDSLQLTGKVVLAETGKIDSTLMVMLHSSSDDSAVVKEMPKYIAKLNNKGEFSFDRLPAKTYRIYALKNASGYRYMKADQLFAFASNPVAAGSADSVVLYAYSLPVPEKRSASPSGSRRKTTGEDAPRLKFTTNLISEKQSLLTDLSLQFEDSLANFDTTKVGFFTDTLFTPVNNYSFQKDSTGKKLTLKHTWKEDTEYHLILNKDFASDSAAKKLLRTDTISFRTNKQSDYGSVKIKFRGIEQFATPVILFVQNDALIGSFTLSGNEFYQGLFTPGDYTIRILQDQNKNGKWDPGNFFNGKIQPELATPIQRKFSIKPNWENEFEIIL